ncbi:aminopeptidase N [Sandaracinobacter sp. RS1-74]|uniref:aminopeptidase N n=1 Tax=Sandaracinobacteroides sayramensis TaxID=2913411 RepID=UPI001EDAF45A|nr:aminopeptidase N [Sandaracinobacteroides sayramensis]MCG2841909.1 aminopeptidase N [Sandaracinobacteroides sayramensis]
MDSPSPLPPLKHLADYRPPAWLVPETRLTFRLAPDRALVLARLKVERNGRHAEPLRLDGEELELLELRVNGEARPLPNDSANGLTLQLEGDEAEIETLVAIRPSANSRLMGLYASGGNLCTQCEAEGFRRITYFPDRPDVLSRYHVRLEADAAKYPVLLSNGNPGASGPLPGGRHFAEWDDPHPKPSYLFAAVAGDLAALGDSFTTRSGREVALAIWVARSDVPRCCHAMESLKASMAWDEEHYGREYDLDRFNIVAVHDFNFGAMENKGLNIFNAKYVLADAETATDWDFDSISAIVAHEYFHNWSGNRVTCRDWFQLSLKEGFTVFRDQQFSASRNSPAVKRIEGVRLLRSNQFPEDDGPLAHPVRPESYMEISNFYTATVYDKGAELIRMMATLMGPARFRRACDRYFEANDGKAATVEDFLEAMEAEGLDSARFRRWYQQPGTPRVSVEALHHPANGQVELIFSQTNPKAPSAAPLPIPIHFALFAHDGRKLVERDDFVLTESEARLLLDGVAEQPVLSLNRGFAAPIVAGPPPSSEGLKLLAAHEDDPFARYEAVQQLMLSALTQTIATGRREGEGDVVDAFSTLLDDWQADPAFVAETLLLPAEGLIGDQLAQVDPEAIHAAREALRGRIAAELGSRLWGIWRQCQADAGDLAPRAKGLRRLKGVLIGLLQAGDGREAAAAAFGQFAHADNMTDRMSALTALSHVEAPERDEALARFHARFGHLPEVLDKWFLVQAGSTRADTVEAVERLLAHPQFDPRNPNRLRALVLGFAGNQPRFHAEDGRGYALLARQVLEADRINPQSAARLVQPLTRWRRFAAPWGPLMRAELQRIAATAGLSRDLTEVVTTGLN